MYKAIGCIIPVAARANAVGDAQARHSISRVVQLGLLLGMSPAAFVGVI